MNAGKEQIKKATYKNEIDVNGNPAGGRFLATGIDITWQNGPLREPGHGFKTPNGAFVETVIFAALQRIQSYQESKFKCHENAIAITKLEEALHWLHARTEAREARGVEGTWNV